MGRLSLCYSWWMVVFVPVFIVAQPVQAQMNLEGAQVVSSDVETGRLGDKGTRETRETRRFTAADLMAQSDVTRVRGVEVNRTEEGLELVLETVAGSERLVPLILPQGNDLVIDILDATLAFSIRRGIEKLNPAPGINRITVNNAEENSIRVTITGENQAPSAEVVPRRENLVLSVTPDDTTAEAAPDEEIDVIATGEAEDDDYYVPNASTATRTDTPIRDVPQSIQVIPRQVIEDQGSTTLEDALRSVAGVRTDNNDANVSNTQTFIIRGFEQANLFRNGDCKIFCVKD